MTSEDIKHQLIIIEVVLSGERFTYIWNVHEQQIVHIIRFIHMSSRVHKKYPPPPPPPPQKKSSQAWELSENTADKEPFRLLGGANPKDRPFLIIFRSWGHVGSQNWTRGWAQHWSGVIVHELGQGRSRDWLRLLLALNCGPSSWLTTPLSSPRHGIWPPKHKWFKRTLI